MQKGLKFYIVANANMEIANIFQRASRRLKLIKNVPWGCMWNTHGYF